MYIKMSDYDDYDDALTLSATYRQLMHINLHWSLIGCSLLAGYWHAGKNTEKKRSYKRRAAQHITAQLLYERLH